MNKIKEIRIKLKCWEASKKIASDANCHKLVAGCESKICELKDTLVILKEPSNIQMHVDTKPCMLCKTYAEKPHIYKTCGSCGRALSQ